MVHAGRGRRRAPRGYRSGVPELTGDFPTGDLPRIAPGAVTVTIERRVDPTQHERFTAWTEDMLAAVRAAPGCLGATVLSPGGHDEPYHMVFRFVDVVHLRRWERSEERSALLERGDGLFLSERITSTAGSDTYFNALGEVERHRGRVGRFFTDVAWVYPASLVFALLTAPLFARLDLWTRVLVSTVCVGLVSRLALRPLRRWWRRRRMLPQNLETR